MCFGIISFAQISTRKGNTSDMMKMMRGLYERILSIKNKLSDNINYELSASRAHFMLREYDLPNTGLAKFWQPDFQMIFFTA